MPKNKHIGSSFEDFLREDGILDEVDARVQKRILAEQLRHEMEAQKLSEKALAKRMDTSRTVVRNLLDPGNTSATLMTMVKAGHALGRELKVSYMPEQEPLVMFIGKQPRADKLVPGKVISGMIICGDVPSEKVLSERILSGTAVCVKVLSGKQGKVVGVKLTGRVSGKKSKRSNKGTSVMVSKRLLRALRTAEIRIVDVITESRAVRREQKTSSAGVTRKDAKAPSRPPRRAEA